MICREDGQALGKVFPGLIIHPAVIQNNGVQQIGGPDNERSAGVDRVTQGLFPMNGGLIVCSADKFFSGQTVNNICTDHG